MSRKLIWQKFDPLPSVVTLHKIDKLPDQITSHKDPLPTYILLTLFWQFLKFV